MLLQLWKIVRNELDTLFIFPYLTNHIVARNHRIAKRIIVSFRGSTDLTTRDWQTNFNAVPTGLKTPKQIKGKMEGTLQDRLLVHRGIYQYLFDNSSIRGEQRFDGIVADIRKAMNKEAGYSIYVTGHRYAQCVVVEFDSLIRTSLSH